MSSLKYNITFLEANAGYEDMTEQELNETVTALKEYIKDVIEVRFNTERSTIEVDLEAVVE